MTSYTWTAEQRRQLGPGCTVVRGDIKERVTIVDVVRALGDHVAKTEFKRSDGYVEQGGCSLSRLDPSTLRPPTLAWLRKEAKRKLGKTATVERGIGGRVHVALDGPYSATFYGDYDRQVPAETLCARFLDALPEVER